MNEKTGWLGRLKAGLSKTSGGITEGIASIFTQRKLDADMLEALEELLISADVGAEVAAALVKEFSAERFDKHVTPEEVKTALAKQIANILMPVAHPLHLSVLNEQQPTKPYVILMVGVNGAGKTTTIGKLAKQFKEQGKHVMLAAADTFRAAAVEQLNIWGERNGCQVISGESGADPGSIAFKALEEAKKQQADVLLVDSAGRLQNKTQLMDELQKIIKVMKKIDETAPHSTVLVLDATTGQNALSQAEIFKSLVKVTGLIVTKLDGTAKGGMVVALAQRFGLPIYAVGVGETANDLQPFNEMEFANNVVGIES